jgi:hypothetical protein
VDRLKKECYQCPDKIIELNQEQAKNVKVPVDASDSLLTNLGKSFSM